MESRARLAIVTGATSGIGRAISLKLKTDGYQVVAIGRQKHSLLELERSGIEGIELDITDTEGLVSHLEGLAPDILVNNAGLMPPLSPFCELEAAEIARSISVNLSATLTITRLLAPRMVDRKRGHIFFTGSTAAYAPAARFALYAATKAGLGAFAQALRQELSPAGVRVTEIVAGRVETALYRDRLSEAQRADMYADETAVQPEDLADMIAAILALPARATIGRFDILPTRPGLPPGIKRKEN